MEFLLIFYIFIIWLMFWSFASVVIYRLKSWQKWTFLWRSNCPKCKNTLKTLDLVPVFSWLFLKWKCRYCKEKVPATYILLELSMWAFFALLTYFIIDIEKIFMWDINEILFLLYLLIIWFFSIIFVFYDLLYMEIPESALAIIITLVLWKIVLENEFSLLTILWIVSIISYYAIMLWEVKNDKLDYLKDFWILGLNWWLIYYIFENWLQTSEIWGAIIATYWAFMFFFLQYALSWWRALWWGDLRIAIFLGLFLWISLTVTGIMVTYISGSIIWIALIIKKLINKDNSLSQIPFWPFLFLWIFITYIWWVELKDWFSEYVINFI